MVVDCFFGSFNIFGLRKDLDDIFEPYGILEENFVLNLTAENENMFFLLQ